MLHASIQILISRMGRIRREGGRREASGVP